MFMSHSLSITYNTGLDQWKNLTNKTNIIKKLNTEMIRPPIRQTALASAYKPGSFIVLPQGDLFPPL